MFLGLRQRYPRGLDGGAIRAAASAANVALGTLLGADDWMGYNADGTGAPGADGPRVHPDVPRPKEK